MTNEPHNRIHRLFKAEADEKARDGGEECEREKNGEDLLLKLIEERSQGISHSCVEARALPAGWD